MSKGSAGASAAAGRQCHCRWQNNSNKTRLFVLTIHMAQDNARRSSLIVIMYSALSDKMLF